MDHTLIKQVIRSFDEGATDIKIVQNGTTHLIGIANQKVYRFARDSEGRVVQHFEAELLQKLEGLDSKSLIQIPRLFSVHDDQHCVVVSFIAGQHLLAEELRQLTDDNLRSVVRQLINFSIGLNQIVTPDDIKALEDSHLGNAAYGRSWRGYLEQAFIKSNLSNHLWLKEIADEYYKKFLTLTHTSSL